MLAPNRLLPRLAADCYRAYVAHRRHRGVEAHRPPGASGDCVCYVSGGDQVSYLVEFPVAGNDSVIVEMDDEQLAGFAPAAVSPGEIAARASESFESTIDKLIPTVRAISDRMKQLAPDELEVSLGVKLTAEAGVIVAKAAGEANFTVTLSWKGGDSG
jgi:Trypsin-co-occurring domain 1